MPSLQRMNGRAKKLLLVLLIVLVGLPALLLAFINTPPGRSVFSSLATKWMQREVRFSGYLYPLLPLGLHVSGLNIAGKENSQYPMMAEIGSMDIGVRTKALLKGKFRLRSLSLIDSTLHLERDVQGNANWSFSSPPQRKKTPRHYPWAICILKTPRLPI